MTKPMDDKKLSEVTGGALPIEQARDGSFGGTRGSRAAGDSAGSGGGPSQTGVVENAAGTAPASGPVDLA